MEFLARPAYPSFVPWVAASSIAGQSAVSGLCHRRSISGSGCVPIMVTDSRRHPIQWYLMGSLITEMSSLGC
jgi:hypothetical protein